MTIKFRYDLLRPFDLERYEAGDSVCTKFGLPVKVMAVQMLGIYKLLGKDVELIANVEINGIREQVTNNSLRMSPLMWIENKPVYPGDKLFVRAYCEHQFREIVAVSSNQGFLVANDGNQYMHNELSWEKPNELKIVVKAGPLNFAQAFAMVKRPTFIRGGIDLGLLKFRKGSSPYYDGGIVEKPIATASQPSPEAYLPRHHEDVAKIEELEQALQLMTQDFQRTNEQLDIQVGMKKEAMQAATHYKGEYLRLKDMLANLQCEINRMLSAQRKSEI